MPDMKQNTVTEFVNKINVEMGGSMKHVLYYLQLISANKMLLITSNSVKKKIPFFIDIHKNYFLQINLVVKVGKEGGRGCEFNSPTNKN